MYNMHLIATGLPDNPIPTDWEVDDMVRTLPENEVRVVIKAEFYPTIDLDGYPEMGAHYTLRLATPEEAARFGRDGGINLIHDE